MTWKRFNRCFAAIVAVAAAILSSYAVAQDVRDEQTEALRLVRAAEDARIAVIEQVAGSVIAIYDDDRQGGGSGVIIDPSGIALTNHHVIAGAGVEGWGGLADGQLYRWTVVGTDPGGDIAIIQMHGRDDFPFSPLGDSAQVRVGDWAMAMGNPFVLTEDESPTVTLGIVSGVNRFQAGAGSNELVYGNCIQVDSSINPGNSGGPLYNMAGEVIGINGRGSFEARGRVNVGLGYAISANQIKNFIPDLLATKLVEHGTLDATFDLRDGKIVCNSIDETCQAYKLGLRLGDELLEFDGEPVVTVNQLLNHLCMLPEGWPAHLVVRQEDGQQREFHLRMYGLPYNFSPPPAPQTPDDQEPSPAQKKAMERQQAMVKLMSTPPGTMRDAALNQKYADWYLAQWERSPRLPEDSPMVHVITDQLLDASGSVGTQTMYLCTDGRFRVEWNAAEQPLVYGFDGQSFWKVSAQTAEKISIVEAKLTPAIVHAATIVAQFQQSLLPQFGAVSLDGGDKVHGQLGVRIKILDDRGDWLYCWFASTNAIERRQIYPAKISASLNTEAPTGGILFGPWSEHGQIQLPDTRRWVEGLDERTRISLVNESVEVLSDWTDQMFTLSESNVSASPEEDR